MANSHWLLEHLAPDRANKYNDGNIFTENLAPLIVSHCIEYVNGF